MESSTKLLTKEPWRKKINLIRQNSSTGVTKSELPKSTRKFIRLEKSRIRERFFDHKKQEEMIDELYKRFLTKPTVAQVEVPDLKEKKTEAIIEKKPTVKRVKVKVHPVK